MVVLVGNVDSWGFVSKVVVVVLAGIADRCLSSRLIASGTDLYEVRRLESGICIVCIVGSYEIYGCYLPVVLYRARYTSIETRALGGIFFDLAN